MPQAASQPGSSQTAPAKARQRLDIALVFAVALVARAGFALLYGGSELVAKFGGNLEDPRVYEWMADNLREHGSLGFRGEPSARRGPAYPVALAAMHVVVGDDYLRIRFVQGVLDAVTAVVVYLAVKVAGCRRAALISGLAYAAYPIYVFNASELMTEILVLFFTGFAVWALAQTCVSGSRLAAAAAGVGCGLMALTRENNLLPGVMWAGLLLVVPREVPLKIKGGRCAAFLLAAAVTYSPWVIRNTRLFGQFVPTGTSGGENLLRSMGGALQGERFDWRECLAEHALLNYYEYHDPANRGKTFPDELDSDRRARQLAAQWISQHPARFVSFGFEKLARSLAQIDPPQRAARGGRLRTLLTWAYRIVAVLGVAGALVAIRRGRGAFVSCLAALALSAMIVLFLFVAWKRYRYVAFDFACIALAGFAVDALLAKAGWREGGNAECRTRNAEC